MRRVGEDRSFSHADAWRDFGYRPTSFRSGLRRRVEGFLKAKWRIWKTRQPCRRSGGRRLVPFCAGVSGVMDSTGRGCRPLPTVYATRINRQSNGRRVRHPALPLCRLSGFFVVLTWRLLGRGGVNAVAATGRLAVYDRFVLPLSRLLDWFGVGRLFGKNLILYDEIPQRKSPKRWL